MSHKDEKLQVAKVDKQCLSCCSRLKMWAAAVKPQIINYPKGKLSRYESCTNVLFTLFTNEFSKAIKNPFAKDLNFWPVFCCPKMRNL